MNEEKLRQRLAEIEEAIKKQNQTINQDMANLNLLEGGRHECLFWLNKTILANAPEVNIEDVKFEG